MRLRLIAAAAIVVTGTLFVSPSLNPDTDHDGVPDAQEISLSTDPASADHYGTWTSSRP